MGNNQYPIKFNKEALKTTSGTDIVNLLCKHKLLVGAEDVYHFIVGKYGTKQRELRRRLDGFCEGKFNTD